MKVKLQAAGACVCHWHEEKRVSGVVEWRLCRACRQTWQCDCAVVLSPERAGVDVVLTLVKRVSADEFGSDEKRRFA